MAGQVARVIGQAVRFVALGDSFTEGVGDDLPDGRVRGWADLVAAGLAASGRQVQYANLAVRGRLLAPIVTEQVEAALTLDPLPTLVSINGGGNDMLRRGFDVDELIGLTRWGVQRCRSAGVDVLLLAGPDPSWQLPFGPTIHARGQQLTDLTVPLAGEVSAFINIWDDEQIREPGYWAADRLHLNAAGHRRAADLVLAELGVPQPPREVPDPGADPGRRAELAYAGRYLAPWLGRRLRGRSSGDGRTAKYPTWQLVSPSNC